MGKDGAGAERNMGIELLRIVSMLSILVLHVLGQGGVLAALPPLSLSYELSWLLEILCYFGVTTYALISGFVGVERRFHISNIVYVHLQVLFYTVLATGAFALFYPGSVGGNELRGMVFPVMTEQYWYYSAYVGVFFFIPMMNHAVVTIYQRYLRFMLIAFLILFSVLPVFFDTDVYGIRQGYSFIWLMVCYFIGAYLKHYGLQDKIKRVRLWGLFFLSVLLTWGFKLVLELFLGYSNYESGRSNMLIAYNSPTVLLASVSLLLIFAGLKPGKRLTTVVRAVSPLCFGVYLTNCHPLMWRYLMKDRFVYYAAYPAGVLILSVLLCALAIFLVGIAIDAVRYLIFEKGKLRQKLRLIEEKLFL